MSATEAGSAHASSGASAGQVDMKFENAVIPVSDVDRSEQFYESLGWRLDDDVSPMDGLRIVQFTPPGSGCSATFGTGIITSAPGSAEATLVVSDIEAAHAELRDRGIDVSDVWHGPPFPIEARQPGASADWQLVQPDGTAIGDIRYTLQTEDGVLLYMRAQSIRHGDPDVLARLARGEEVDAGEYIFRASAQIETSATELAWLNKGIFISVGGRISGGVAYDTYVVE